MRWFTRKRPAPSANNGGTTASPNALPRGFLLYDQYRVESLMGSGGFSFVYLAYRVATQSKVVVKEYYPHALVQRIPGGRVLPLGEDQLPRYQIGLARFFQEGLALSKVQHRHVVRVSNFFKFNGTAYLVMDFEEGRDLRWFIKRHPGRLDQDFLAHVFPPVLRGLAALHDQGYLHLDIKPANIMINDFGRAVLLDFGAVQPMGDGKRFEGVQTLTHGFAAPEQYQQGPMGPWADIYAIGMTIVASLIGTSPPSATERAKKDTVPRFAKTHGRRFDHRFLEGLDRAVTLDWTNRPHDIHEMLRACGWGETDPAEEPSDWISAWLK
jgi:serine/threonine protein kinase